MRGIWAQLHLLLADASLIQACLSALSPTIRQSPERNGCRIKWQPLLWPEPADINHCLGNKAQMIFQPLVLMVRHAKECYLMLLHSSGQRRTSKLTSQLLINLNLRHVFMKQMPPEMPSPHGARWIGKTGMWVLSGNCRYSLISLFRSALLSCNFGCQVKERRLWDGVSSSPGLLNWLCYCRHVQSEGSERESGLRFI